MAKHYIQVEGVSSNFSATEIVTGLLYKVVNISLKEHIVLQGESVHSFIHMGNIYTEISQKQTN